MVTIVGIEEHWVFESIDRVQRELPPGLRDPSMVLNDNGDTGRRLLDLGEGRIDAMDRQGVDRHVLALAPSATQGLPIADAITLSRDANDTVVAAVAAHPDRFSAMATLPMSDPTAAAVELQRAQSHGLRGTMVYGRVEDTPLDDPCFEDLWTVAAAGGHPIFIHPQIPPPSIRATAYAGFGEFADLALSTFSWGWHLEAGLAALRLMAAGVLDRHPDLRLVLGHWGELLLFWHERANSLTRITGRDRNVTEYLRRNVWITASGMLDPAMLHHALEVTTPDHIVFSTDYPFQQPTRAQIDEFIAAIPDPATREVFLHDNAAAVFGLSS